MPVPAPVERFFHLRERGTTVGREFRGAVATFLTMAYILFVNPDILAKAGVPHGSAVACTAAAAAVCCVLMGVVANFPLALASGMGLNAVIAFHVAPKAGSWEAAMGLVVLDGVVVLLLVLSGLREAVMHAIPRDLRLAIGAGIGLFIAFIGLVNAGLVVTTNAPNPPLTYGRITSPQAGLAMVGLLVTAALMAWRVTGAMVIGIVATTLMALAFGVTSVPKEFAWPSFEAAFRADVRGAMRPDLVPLLLSVMMVDFFDTLGTASAVAEQAGLHDERGRIPGVRRALVVDSVSASIGGLFGASSVTSYVESAAGVAEGARTGLHSVFVGLFFAAAIFAAPVASMVPPAATAPALILVGFLMITQFAGVDFTKLESAIPAFLILLTIPLTFSISHGIGYGFISYAVIQLARGHARAVHPLMYLTAVAFATYFLFQPA